MLFGQLNLYKERTPHICMHTIYLNTWAFAQHSSLPTLYNVSLITLVVAAGGSGSPSDTMMLPEEVLAEEGVVRGVEFPLLSVKRLSSPLILGVESGLLSSPELGRLADGLKLLCCTFSSSSPLLSESDI
jgi:hypothetical protein